MKARGFTLMELLGSVVIMSIVLTIATISVVSIINSSKQKAYNTQVQLIVTKAKDWALNNESKLAPDGGINFIELSTLVSNGYIDNSTVTDPRNGATMSGCIVITYNSSTSQYEYRYSDSACSAEQDKYGPTWTSTNSATVEVAKIFNYGLVTAQSQSSKKNALTVTGPTLNIVDGSYNIITSNVDVIDTSYVGRIYSLTYHAYDPIYKHTFDKTYYVKIVDNTTPTITLGDLRDPEKKDAKEKIKIDTDKTDGEANIYILTDTNSKYAVMTMKVNDNSCDGLVKSAQDNNNCTTTLTAKPSSATINLNNSFKGLHAAPIDIKYTATDSSGNSTYYTIHYYIAPKTISFDTAGEKQIEIYYPGTYSLTGSGAQGDAILVTKPGGKGGTITGTIDLNVGDILTFSIGNKGGGGAGASATPDSKAGGKSTIISKAGKTLLIAAGGGAGGILTEGGAGGSGTGAGAPYPKVCTGIFNKADGAKRDINIDTTDTTSSGNAVCPTRTSDAYPYFTNPSNCSSAVGIAGTNGSGGGSSGTLEYTAHECKQVTDTCRNITNCHSCNFGCSNPANQSTCRSSAFGSCQEDAYCHQSKTCYSQKTCTKYQTCTQSQTCYQSKTCGGDPYDCNCYNHRTYSYNYGVSPYICYGNNNCSFQVTDSGTGTGTCGCWFDHEICSTCYHPEYECGSNYDCSYDYDCSYSYECGHYYDCSYDYVCGCNKWPSAAEYLAASKTYSRIVTAVGQCGCNSTNSDDCFDSATWLANETRSDKYDAALKVCGCDVWNWKDGGSNYQTTSSGYGGEGGLSSVANGVTNPVKTDGNKENDGSAKIEIKK